MVLSFRPMKEFKSALSFIIREKTTTDNWITTPRVNDREKQSLGIWYARLTISKGNVSYRI